MRLWYSRRGRIGLGARARREEAAVSWNVLWSWLVIAVLTGAGRASARESPVELGQKLARTRAALTAVRGQLNPAQWSRLSGKLVEAEKTLAEYEALVPPTGRAAAVTEGASAMADREVAALEAGAAARSATQVLGAMAAIFISLATISSDDDPRLYQSRQKQRLEEQLPEVGRVAEEIKKEIESAQASREPKKATSEVQEEDEEDGDIHHIATDKNPTSTVYGGPWTPIFRDLFAKAGMSLNDPANRVRVKGHKGPHPEEYHKEIFRQVSLAVATCNGVEQCRIALTKELRRLAVLCATPGTQLNRWVTRATP